VLPLLPVTPETVHLLSVATLSKTKPEAYLVNVSRGSVIDEEAIADELDSGVFPDTPPTRSKWKIRRHADPREARCRPER